MKKIFEVIYWVVLALSLMFAVIFTGVKLDDNTRMFYAMFIVVAITLSVILLLMILSLRFKDEILKRKIKITKLELKIQMHDNEIKRHKSDIKITGFVIDNSKRITELEKLVIHLAEKLPKSFERFNNDQ